MENYQKDPVEKTTPEGSPFHEPRFESQSGRVLAGLIVVLVGALLLARQAGVYVPWWLFSWQMLLIGIGLFVGAKHSFRGFGWAIPVLIGGAFLAEEFLPELSFHNYLWPVILIGIGVMMILRPRRRSRHRMWDVTSRTSDDAVDSISFFGGSKKLIISKNFKGGELTTFFGATDLDLMQADFQGTVMLNITQVFGGTKLIVPANWNIKSDIVCLFGGIEDKRSQMKEGQDITKVLRLEGTCLFGGVEIKSY